MSSSRLICLVRDEVEQDRQEDLVEDEEILNPNKQGPVNYRFLSGFLYKEHFFRVSHCLSVSSVS